MKNIFFYLIFLSLVITVITGCSDEEDDFTKGNFYPIDYTPPETDTMKVDTMVHNPQDCWDDNVIARHNETFNNHFTRYGEGWTGGDATYSIPIDATTNLWLFGDTFLGTVNPNRSRSGAPLIRNTMMLQEGENFTTFYGGTISVPEAFLKPPEEEWWYWPGHGQMHNGNIQVIMFAMGSAGMGGGGFDFEYKAIDLVTLSLPDLKVISQERKMLFEGANYGATLLQTSGFTYIYAAYKDGFSKFLHTARIEGVDLSQDWEYYAGADIWSADVSESKSFFSNVSEQFSVLERSNKFYLMTQNYFLGSELYLYSSESPTGPFENEQILYCTPENEGNIITYNAFVHEQFSTEHNLLISYNNNSLVFSELFSNADNYRPHFVNVEGWE